MITLKRASIFLAMTLVSVFGFWFWHRHNQKQDLQNSNESLKADEEVAIIVDPVKRKITTIRANNIKTVTLPDRPTRISLLKGDGIHISSPQFGTEIRPFLAGAYTLNGGKLGAGIDLFYYKRADAGLGFITNPVYVQDTTLFIGVSMFVYSNTSIVLGLDNKTTPILGVKVRM